MGIKLLSILLEESVDYLLLLFHILFAFFEAVALTLDVDDSAMVQYAIKNGGSNGDIGENLIPLGKGLVGCKDGGCFLVSLSDELKEQVSSIPYFFLTFETEHFSLCAMVFIRLQ